MTKHLTCIMGVKSLTSLVHFTGPRTQHWMRYFYMRGVQYNDFNIRASIATALSTHPSISECLYVKYVYTMELYMHTICKQTIRHQIKIPVTFYAGRDTNKIYRIITLQGDDFHFHFSGRKIKVTRAHAWWLVRNKSICDTRAFTLWCVCTR